MAGAAAAACVGVSNARNSSAENRFDNKGRDARAQEDDDKILGMAGKAYQQAKQKQTMSNFEAMKSGMLSKQFTTWESLPAPNQNGTPGRQFINSTAFTGVIYTVILLNGLQMGLQVDLNYGSWETLWQVLEHFFTAVFALEMIIKLYVLELDYFLIVPTNRWNILDFVIAWLSIIGSWIIPATTGGDSPKSLRAFQFFRLLRMLKILKMRRDLLALIEGLQNSLKSMFWVGVLLFIIHYCVGIFFAQVIGGEDFEERYAELEFDSKDSFGSLWRSMMTLFSICVVDNWSDVVMPVAQVQPYLVPVFMCFLIMTSFGLLNALIGIIVERTTAAIAQIQDQENKQARQRKLDKVKALVQICAEIDESGDGTISPAELEQASNNEKFSTLMAEIDLPPGFKGLDLHLMLDADGEGSLTPEEFINGMYQLIFCDEFQRECLMKHSISQVRHEMQAGNKLFEQQLWTIRRDLALLRGVELPDDAPPDFGKSASLSRGLGMGKALSAHKKSPNSANSQKVTRFVQPTSYGANSMFKKAVGKEDDGERQAEIQNDGDMVPLIRRSAEVSSTPSPQPEASMAPVYAANDAEQILSNQESLSAALSALAQEKLESDGGVLIERVRERMAQVESALRNLEQSSLNRNDGVPPGQKAMVMDLTQMRPMGEQDGGSSLMAARSRGLNDDEPHGRNTAYSTSSTLLFDLTDCRQESPDETKAKQKRRIISSRIKVRKNKRNDDASGNPGSTSDLDDFDGQQPERSEERRGSFFGSAGNN